jgi:hypothetical protein
MATGAVEMESELAAVARSLHRVLNRRGVSPDDAEDLVQETLTRAWASRDAFTSRRHLVMWCLRVAGNLRTDEWRHRQRRVDDRTVPDDPDDRPAADVELRVLHVLAVEETARALPRLRPAERDALLRWLRGEDPPGGVPLSTEKWWRRMAREQLSRLVEGYPAVALWWRGMVWRWRRRAAAMGHGGARVAVPLMVGAAIITLVPGGGSQSKSAAAAPPPSEPVARAAVNDDPALGSPRRTDGIVSGSHHRKPSSEPPRGGDRVRRVDVPGPVTGTGAHVWTAPNDGTKPLVCVRGVEFETPDGQRVGQDISACVDHPLRDTP